eukprot:TRINITY_DN33013_c0_g1_i1.p3 TRINITY_DN33013_c0_g1~~TRINITY_DN33013_c0_g1_i1.p3  ORF type:complete len:101 (-),score=4.98 TRINITY_DN33013_c0_g1_i1:34-336(-)
MRPVRCRRVPWSRLGRHSTPSTLATQAALKGSDVILCTLCLVDLLKLICVAQLALPRRLGRHAAPRGAPAMQTTRQTNTQGSLEIPSNHSTATPWLGVDV